MAKYKELAYLVLDEIKAISDDSIITIDHAIFLLNHYRNYLIKLKVLKEGFSSLAKSNTLTICVDMELASMYNDDGCEQLILKSKLKIPSLISDDGASVYPVNTFLGLHLCMVSKNRFKVIGYNKYMLNIIYVTLNNDDNYLYCKGNNPLFKYLNKLKVSGIFDDVSEAANLSCNGNNESCDILELDFPIESDLIPLLVESVVKELSAAQWRQYDNVNNASDDLAELANYIRLNTKSNLAKQISQ